MTLSSEGWIDVVQNGAAIRSDAHTGAKGCPDVRKSVRFPVGSFPIVLQLSGVPVDLIFNHGPLLPWLETEPGRCLS